jgi:mRNA interferase RelE/StbE
MPGYRAALPPRVADRIRQLPPQVKRAVRAAVRELATNPQAGEPLHGELEGLLKYRVRRYRIVYRILRTSRILRILAVGERRNVYEEVAELLREKE